MRDHCLSEQLEMVQGFFRKKAKRHACSRHPAETGAGLILSDRCANTLPYAIASVHLMLWAHCDDALAASLRPLPHPSL